MVGGIRLVTLVVVRKRLEAGIWKAESQDYMVLGASEEHNRNSGCWISWERIDGRMVITEVS